MSSLRRWRKIGHGQFHKWETPGGELEGRWRGPHDGRYGPLGTVETPTGFVTFPLHTALSDRLKRVREGQEVLIRYTGKQTSNAGRVFKAFEVYVAGDDPLELSTVFRLDPSASGEEPPAQAHDLHDDDHHREPS
jgi:hypothetical protein